MTRPLKGIAFLVMAHENAAQLLLLLRALSDGGGRVILHLDPRAFTVRSDLLQSRLPREVRLLPSSLSHVVRWGGFGAVEATLTLMREALLDTTTQQVCLLSGTHLPIRPPEEIAAFVMDGREHIDLRFACMQPPDKEALHRFWYRGVPGREEGSALLRAMNRNAWRLGKRDLVHGLRGLTPFVGSQWWCLTADCARHILAFLDANPWYTAFFRSARIPDESFFHTLVGASPFVERLGQPPSWQAMAGYSPLVLNAAAMPPAIASGRPFARKFDLRHDAAAVRLALAYAAGDLPRRRRSGGGAADPRTANPERVMPRRPRLVADRDPAASLPDGITPVGPVPRLRPGEILAVFVVRNEALRLPSALAHARSMGVDRAFVLDNRSGDATRAIAAQHNWVHVFDAPGSYAAANFGIDWANAVLDRFARGHWSLILDADEVLVFPGSDQVGLPVLCRHLERMGSEALTAVMLDCFPRGPLREVDFRSGDDLLTAAPFFEPPRLRCEVCQDFPYAQYYGGIRERLFFPETDPARPARLLRQKLYNLGWRLPSLRRRSWFRALAPRLSPNLMKVPLVRWREGARLLASTHLLAPMALASPQPSGVLLHFKFLQDFHARAIDAVARGAHFDASQEYRRYLAALESDPDFALHGPLSVLYDGPDQLARLGLMADTPEWAAARAQGHQGEGGRHGGLRDATRASVP